MQNSIIYLNTRKCKACWDCISNCPQNVLGRVNFLFHKHAIVVDSSKCAGCGKCMSKCASGAISIVKVQPKTVQS